MTFCGSYLNTLPDDVVDVIDEGVWFCDVVDTLDIVSVLPSFLPANSYMSPKMPAKVLRKFFMVSSASSTTDVWLTTGPGRVDAVVDLDPVDVCEAERNGKWWVSYF